MINSLYDMSDVKQGSDSVSRALCTCTCQCTCHCTCSCIPQTVGAARDANANYSYAFLADNVKNSSIHTALNNT